MLFLKLKKKGKPISVPIVEQPEKTILKNTEKTIKEKPVKEIKEKPVKEAKKPIKEIKKPVKEAKKPVSEQSSNCAKARKEVKEKATKEISIDELFQREKGKKQKVEDDYESTSEEQED